MHSRLHPPRGRVRLLIAFTAVVAALVGPTSASAAPAPAASLTPGGQLAAGASLASADGRVRLLMQTDGNLVLRNPTRVIWTSATPGHPGARLVLQTDGNLVLRDAGGTTLFSTGPKGATATLTLANDGHANLTAAGAIVWSTPNTTLNPGQVLTAGDALQSPGRAYSLVMQADGNLVLRRGSAPVWNSRTNGRAGAYAVAQGDGNFVIYAGSVAVFTAETYGRPGAHVSVQDDGNVVVAVGAQPYWSSRGGSVLAQRAVNAATSFGYTRGERVAVAVWDRRVGRYYVAGDVDSYYASASVMKVFIATRLLVSGQSRTPAIAALMWSMITLSDDNAADYLYGVVGGAGVATWAAARYHLSGPIAPSPNPYYWGLTRITARAMAAYYNAIAGDPVVGPWLLAAMANMRAPAADGWPQAFGIPSATNGWRVKQGWMCCLDSVTRMHSTGFVNGDRYTVAVLTQGSTAVYGAYGRDTVTGMAVRLLPGGLVPH